MWRKLSKKDLVALDNVYYDVISEEKEKKVLLITEKNVFLEKSLSNLENIYNSPLNDILKSEKYLKTIEYFKNNKCYLDVCKHCSFKNRFK